MAKVELKQPIVDEISNYLNGAAGVVLVDYRGLTEIGRASCRERV